MEKKAQDTSYSSSPSPLSAAREKIERLSVSQRKLILWISIVLFSIIVGIFFFQHEKKILQKINLQKTMDQLRIGDLQESINKNIEQLNNIKLPKISFPATTTSSSTSSTSVGNVVSGANASDTTSVAATTTSN